MDCNGPPRYRELMRIVEPFSYRDRLTMPKLLINAAGDQFFLPDSSQFYFDELKGEKYLRYVPNADHSLRNSDARETLVAYYDAVLRGAARPKFSWKFEKDGTIRVTATDKPTEVKVWQATNPDARDFRLETIGTGLQELTLSEEGDGIYVAKVSKPEKGWTAYFVELTFPSGGKYPFKFTTACARRARRPPVPGVQTQAADYRYSLRNANATAGRLVPGGRDASEGIYCPGFSAGGGAVFGSSAPRWQV